MHMSTSANSGAAIVLDRVHSAFGNLEIPSQDEIVCECPSEKDRSSSDKIRAALTGVHWRDLETDFLQTACFSFCYLSATGYRFYLPSLLKTCLVDWPTKSDFIHSTVF